MTVKEYFETEPHDESSCGCMFHEFCPWQSSYNTGGADSFCSSISKEDYDKEVNAYLNELVIYRDRYDRIENARRDKEDTQRKKRSEAAKKAAVTRRRIKFLCRDIDGEIKWKRVEIRRYQFAKDMSMLVHMLDGGYDKTSQYDSEIERLFKEMSELKEKRKQMVKEFKLKQKTRLC
jgi:hypothetical protein